MEIIFADNIEELNLKSMGLYHDHCYHLYRGETKNICDDYRYKHLMTEDKNYCLIYDEDKPYIPPKTTLKRI